MNIFIDLGLSNTESIKGIILSIDLKFESIFSYQFIRVSSIFSFLLLKIYSLKETKRSIILSLKSFAAFFV